MLKWYVACPAAFATGGPDALHQLCYKLTKLGEDAKMFYVGAGINPVHPDYAWYQNRYTTAYEDSEESVLILPEIYGGLIPICNRGIPCFWWLSWDNFFVASRESATRYLNDLKTYNVTSLSQSVYAKDMLSKLTGMEALLLVDYVGRFHKEQAQYVSEKTEDIILYNPSKGQEITSQLIREDAGRHTWVGLSKTLNQRQLTEAMQKAKLYVDFGHHPGRDRFPRETVLYNCCIITGRRGGSGYYEDIPIGDQYKWADPLEHKKEILSLIDDVCRNYPAHIGNFASYKSKVAQDEAVFESQVLALIEHVKRRRGIIA